MQTKRLGEDYTYVALELLYNERSHLAKRYYKRQQQQRSVAHGIAQQKGPKRIHQVLGI